MNTGIIYMLFLILLVVIVFLTIIILKDKFRSDENTLAKEKDFRDFVLKEATNLEIKQDEILRFYLQNENVLRLKFVSLTRKGLRIKNKQKFLQSLVKNY